MKEKRPKPEYLLQRAKEEAGGLGKLKIFFGAAPGVGKTHAMLEDAQSKREQGLDIVVGVVESHGRKEIESMLKKLEKIPKQKVSYHGQEMAEFDLDAALKRNPGIILIDEMAHTNVPGLRHIKRWQDIKELLDRGIDVYTTLNVQHIESLNDVVSQIIHTRVKETVPDFMLEMADTVELIDLPPEDLLKRLQEGKVYLPAQAEVAAEHFFRKGNLIALREMALRVTAERVSAQVLLYRQGQSIKHIWPTKEKLLVCVGSKTESTKLVRAARRMAKSLHAEWTAVYVKNSLSPISEEEELVAINNLRLAEQLGAQSKILTGLKTETEIIHFAHEQNITKIVIGKHQRSWWQRFFSLSLTDRLIRDSGEIDVYIITEEKTHFRTIKPVPIKRLFPWRIYAIAIGTVALMTSINLLLFPFLHTSNLIMMYILGIVAVSLFGVIGPALLTALLSIVAYTILFVPPFYRLNITDTQFIFTLMVLLLLSYTISRLTTLMRRQTELARFLEKRTATLHELSRRLAGTRGTDQLLTIAVHYLAEVFDSSVLALLADHDQLLIKAVARTGKILNEKEESIARWVYDMGQAAGLGTDTLSFSDAVYLPLLVQQKSIGVLRVHPSSHQKLFTPEQMHLLENCTNQIALAINVDELQEQRKRSELKIEKDRARSHLLDSMAHDLRTPIVAVLETASSLMEIGDELDTRRIKQFSGTMYFELEKLNQLINNLLQITQLEGEQIKLHKKLNSLNKTIHDVVSSAKKTLNKKPIQLHVPTDLPDFKFDKALLQEVFINLIDNAAKFTPPETSIEILVETKDKYVIVSVKDEGPGIAPEEAKQLFDKYYRGKNLNTEGGLGLGLAICRIIIIAHGGKIWAENRPHGGAAFYFTLPLGA